MMHADAHELTAGLDASTRMNVMDLPVLSRDDKTWTQFTGADNVAETALRGQWTIDETRALVWRLLLEVIPRDAPPSRWGECMFNKRNEYRRLKADHRVDIAKVLDTTDPMAANPLFSGSGSGDDPWSHFYERKEMTDTIKADLERLYPRGCGSHFLAPARQKLLLSVLSLWADLHPSTGYRQGMHEVLAPLVLALEKEVAAAMRAAEGSLSRSHQGALPFAPSAATAEVNESGMQASLPASGKAALGDGSSPEDLEADAFWLFAAIMEGLEGFYEHGTGHADRRSSGGSDGEGDSPVVEMCKRLQGPRMQEADPQLQQHLADLDISPQLYGMKWARLMFGREFRVEGVLRLWDHIFASSWLKDRPHLPACVEAVAMAMVLSVREQLLAEDSTGCLQLLMRYPPDQSVSTVIDLSLALGQPGSYRHSRHKENASLPHAAGSPDPARRTPLHSDSGPAWLMDGGRGGADAGSSTQPRGSWNDDSQSAGSQPLRGVNRSRNNGATRGGTASGLERGGGIEGSGDVKNNWQHGLDEFTRRALSAAQDVAKLAVQTVERTQGIDSRPTGGGGTSISASEAQMLARRLRTISTALEAGETSTNVAAQEMKEVARLLEGGQGKRASTNPVGRAARVTLAPGTTAAGRGVRRGFSTYSEDDGNSDGLYTRDL